MPDYVKPYIERIETFAKARVNPLNSCTERP